MNVTIHKTKKAYTPWVVSYFVSGKRFRNYRKTKTAAELLKKKILQRRGDLGTSGFDLSSSELGDAVRAMAILDGRISLVEAADFWIRNADAANDITIEEVKADFYADRSGTSEVYQAFLRNKIDRFVEHVGEDRRIATITTREITRYLESQPYATETISNIRRALGTLFEYAMKQEVITKNPVRLTSSPKILRGTPKFLPLEAVESIFSEARGLDLEMVTPLALSAFFGIRSYEVTRMTDEAINRTDKTIYIGPEVSKTGHPRLIENLPERCWNAIAIPLVPISQQMFIRRRRRIYEAAGVEWFHSALRKTFITYAVAAFQSAERVALIVGHRQTTTLHTHYRGLVPHEQGKLYLGLDSLQNAKN